MAPEQARGQVVDRRADIWAFGVVTYEMLTGTRPFEGESRSDVLAALLNKEPDWSALPSGVPARVQELLRLCLAKDRKHRLQAIGDARIFLNAPAEDSLSTTGVSRRSVVGWSVAGLLALGLPVGWWSRWRAVQWRRGSAVSPSRPRHRSRRSLTSRRFRLMVCASPSWPTVILPSGDWTRARSRRWLARRVPRTPSFPLMGNGSRSSPRARSKRWPSTAVPQSRCATPAACTVARGMTTTRLLRRWIKAARCSECPPRVARHNPSRIRSAQVTGIPTRNWPQVLPSEMGVLFGAGNGSGQGSLQVLTPHHGVKTLVRNTTHGRYLPGGYLVYHQEGTLFAAPVDPGRFELIRPRRAAC